VILQDAAALYYEAWDDGLRPDEKLSLVEWSDTYRFLPQVATKEHGRYSTARTPYVREIMEKLSPEDPTKEIVFQKSAQIGGTEIGVCWFGYVVHKSPGPMLQVLPTVDLARDFSKQKLQPTISETPVLAARIRENKSRDAGNTILSKNFPGGIYFLGGSNSPAGFRQRSIRFLFLDDVDGYESDVGGEGDPVDLAKKRTNTYAASKKILQVSTPTVKGISRIERSFLASDQRYYEIPCPHCGTYQRLIWGGTGFDYGIKFERDDEGVVIDAWYVCRECKERINENAKTQMLDAGKWVATKPGREVAGYQISALYSPLGWVSWREIVTDFLKVENSAERLKTWTNTVLGETFEEEGSQPDWVALKNRSEPYKILEVPSAGLLLTAGVDVQQNRLAVTVKAYGEGEESWLIYWIELYGDPTTDEPWNQLDELLNRSYRHASGAELYIAAMAIDAGYKTQDVLHYARLRAPKVMATKGSSKAAQPVLGKPTWQDVTYDGRKIPGGVQLWPLGTDTAKGTIYARLGLEKPGPGYIHFPIGIEDAYFQQLTAEKIVTKYIRGYPKQEWVKIYERNEALDCEVMAYAAAIRAGLVHINWEELRKNLGKPKADKPARKPKSSGWVKKSSGGSWIQRG
jgi:phage terminase large subunit GpA-like protein